MPPRRVIIEHVPAARTWLENLRYSVEVFAADESRLEEVVARVGDLTVAQAAYDAAVPRYPGKLVMLCSKARVLRRSDCSG
jgi:hypothetical protein